MRCAALVWLAALSAGTATALLLAAVASTDAPPRASALCAVALFAVAGICLAAREKRRDRALRALGTAAEEIVAGRPTALDGELTAAERDGATDATTVLTRNLARVAASMAEREARIRAEAARQELDAEIQRALALAQTEADVLHVASGALDRVLAEAPAEILLADPAQKELHLAAFSHGGVAGCAAESPSACAAMRGGRTLRVLNASSLDACPRLRDRRDRRACAACVPLAVMGRSIGVLHVTTDDVTDVDEKGLEQLELVATHVGNRLGMLQMLEVFQSQAATDVLTGLPNRRSFEERAPAILRRRSSAVVAIVDADHFKTLNDTYGHAAGDLALRQLAGALTASVARVGGFAARLGGEEFVIVLPQAADAAVETLEQLRAELAATQQREQSPRFTVSVGVAPHAEDGRSLSDLLSAADAALYRAKDAGRDCVVVTGTQPPQARPPTVMRKRSAA